MIDEIKESKNSKEGKHITARGEKVKVERQFVHSKRLWLQWMLTDKRGRTDVSIKDQRKTMDNVKDERCPDASTLQYYIEFHLKPIEGRCKMARDV